jgi:hypothetical protein
MAKDTLKSVFTERFKYAKSINKSQTSFKAILTINLILFHLTPTPEHYSSDILTPPTE